MSYFFSDISNPIHAVSYFARKKKLGINLTAIRNKMETHPDYPSMLSIYDTLFDFQVKPITGFLEKERFLELTTPFIAYTNIKDEEFVVVTGIKGNQVRYFSGNKKSKKNFKTDFLTFMSFWTGHILTIENSNLKYKFINNVFKRIKEFVYNQRVVLILAFLLCAGILVNFQQLIQNNNYAIFSIHQLLFYLGFIISIILLWYEIDSKNNLLKKICFASKKTNCNAVLNSNHAKLGDWLSWSELGFYYFGGGYLIFITIPNDALSFSGPLSVLALFYIIYSLYYQGVVMKQWCPLCLSIQFILFLTGVSSIIYSIYQIPNIDTFWNIFPKIIILFCFLIPIWSFYKEGYFKKKELKFNTLMLARFKRNIPVFEYLLKSQKSIVDPPADFGIIIGNPDAKNKIVKVCNPFCVPCSKAHSIIENIIDTNDNVKVQIIFTTISNTANLNGNPVKNILSLNKNKSNTLKIRKALGEWYNDTEKNQKKFNENYPIQGDSSLYDIHIQKMSIWCVENGIQYTPTYFINGYKIPDVYSIDDMKFLLNEE